MNKRVVLFLLFCVSSALTGSAALSKQSRQQNAPYFFKTLIETYQGSDHENIQLFFRTGLYLYLVPGAVEKYHSLYNWFCDEASADQIIEFAKFNIVLPEQKSPYLKDQLNRFMFGFVKVVLYGALAPQIFEAFIKMAEKEPLSFGAIFSAQSYASTLTEFDNFPDPSRWLWKLGLPLAQASVTGLLEKALGRSALYLGTCIDLVAIRPLFMLYLKKRHSKAIRAEFNKLEEELPLSCITTANNCFTSFAIDAAARQGVSLPIASSTPAPKPNYGKAS